MPTRLAAWFVGIALPVAVLTALSVGWNWRFALLSVAVAFVLQALVHFRNAGLERFAHVFVLAGCGAPLAVRFYFGEDPTTVGVVHIAAVLVVAIVVGYLLGDRARRALANRSLNRAGLAPPG